MISIYRYIVLAMNVCLIYISGSGAFALAGVDRHTTTQKRVVQLKWQSSTVLPQDSLVHALQIRGIQCVAGQHRTPQSSNLVVVVRDKTSLGVSPGLQIDFITDDHHISRAIDIGDTKRRDLLRTLALMISEYVHVTVEQAPPNMIAPPSPSPTAPPTARRKHRVAASAASSNWRSFAKKLRLRTDFEMGSFSKEILRLGGSIALSYEGDHVMFEVGYARIERERLSLVANRPGVSITDSPYAGLTTHTIMTSSDELRIGGAWIPFRSGRWSWRLGGSLAWSEMQVLTEFVAPSGANDYLERGDHVAFQIVVSPWTELQVSLGWISLSLRAGWQQPCIPVSTDYLGADEVIWLGDQTATGALFTSLGIIGPRWH